MFEVIISIAILSFIAFSYWIGGGYPYKNKIVAGGFNLNFMNIFGHVRTDEGESYVLILLPVYGIKHFIGMLKTFLLIGLSYSISVICIILSLIINFMD
jgi:hypothetical protein